MLMVKERRAADAAGVAISVLLDAGAIRECEVHGWMMDRTDPDAPGARPRRRPPGSDRPVYLWTRQSPLFRTCWIRSGTRARSARPRTKACAAAGRLNVGRWARPALRIPVDSAPR